jgi:hypothetical protein
MFRYRCPHCSQVLQALEIRAGKTTICSKCSRPLTIPSDRSQWLNERGDPLAASPTLNLSSGAAGRLAAPRDEHDAGDDVLGAIFVGSDAAPTGLTAKDLPPFAARAGQPAAEPPPGPAPRTGRIPFPLPDAPRSAAWLIPPSRAEDARPTAAAPPAPAPAETPAPAARAEEPPAPEPERPPAPPVEPEEAGVARLFDLPPARHGEESYEGSGSIFHMDPPPVESPSEVGLLPAEEAPAAETKPAEPTAEPRPDETVVAPTPALAKPPEPRKAAPPEPPRAEPPRRSGRPRLEPVPVPVTPPRGAGREPHRRRVVATTPAPLPRTDPDPAVFAEPFRAHEQEEIAAHLTAALTSRMKPPPEPPRDLRPSTALWLVATGIGATLLLLALVTSGNYLWAAGYVGAVEVAIGYGWIVWLAFRREPRRGLLCAIPPLTAGYLIERKYAKLRPLRFVVTGLVLIALAAVGGLAQSRTRGWAGVQEPGPPAPSPADLEKMPKLDQIRAYRKQRSIDPLVRVLEVLAKTDPAFSEDAKDRAELTAELRTLCSDQHADVRVAALAAYARWGGDEARGACLRFVASESQDERRAALRLLPRWKDPEVARAVAARIGRPGTETTLAVEALLEIGGPAAEQAAIPLLRAEDQGTRLTAIDILEKVGGPDAAAVLTEMGNSDDPAVRQRAAVKAQAIKARLQGPKK